MSKHLIRAVNIGELGSSADAFRIEPPQRRVAATRLAAEPVSYGVQRLESAVAERDQTIAALEADVKEKDAPKSHFRYGAVAKEQQQQWEQACCCAARV